jgi:hypothetical protein
LSEPAERAATWKRVTASILDFFTAFFLGGYLIGWATGGITAEGFNLTGGPALILFAVIVLYFYLGRRWAGGTLWDRIFRIARPQPP